MWRCSLLAASIIPDAAPTPASILDETIEFVVPHAAWHAVDAVAIVRQARTDGIERPSIDATTNLHARSVRLSCRVAIALNIRSYRFSHQQAMRFDQENDRHAAHDGCDSDRSEAVKARHFEGSAQPHAEDAKPRLMRSAKVSSTPVNNAGSLLSWITRHVGFQ